MEKNVKNIGKLIQAEEILTYVDRWPLAINMLSAIFCLGCSAVFHLYFI